MSAAFVVDVGGDGRGCGGGGGCHISSIEYVN
jgi:hypothetical protein